MCQPDAKIIELAVDEVYLNPRISRLCTHHLRSQCVPMFSHFVYVNNIKTKYKINWGHFLRYEPKSQFAQIMYIFTYFCKSTVRARVGLEIS